MRSIIFTSLIAMAIGPLSAEATPLGCYARDYDEAHLAAHPDQVVRSIRLDFRHDEKCDQDWVAIAAIMADQGHARRDGHGGRHFDQSASCHHGDNGFACSVDCDGGSFTVTREEGDILEITTYHFSMGAADGCGGVTNLAEALTYGEPTIYRLYRSSADDCVVN